MPGLGDDLSEFMRPRPRRANGALPVSDEELIRRQIEARLRERGPRRRAQHAVYRLGGWLIRQGERLRTWAE